MAITHTKIASVTVGSGGASTIDFSSIPSTYTDLCLVASLRGNNGGVYETPQIRFNGLTTNLSTRRIISDGSSSPQGTTYYTSNIYVVSPSSGATASTFGNLNFYIPNYTGSTNKSLATDSVTENNATEAETNLGAGLWASTAAINQITLVPQGSLFVQYSTATLYGIKNA